MQRPPVAAATPGSRAAAHDDSHRPPLGLPVRELLNQAYNYKRDRISFEFVLWAIFTAIFFAIVYTIEDGTTSASVNMNINTAIISQQFGFGNFPNFDMPGVFKG